VLLLLRKEGDESRKFKNKKKAGSTVTKFWVTVLLLKLSAAAKNVSLFQKQREACWW
jgi:hypothetical protein